jgi:hypothetical protein
LPQQAACAGISLEQLFNNAIEEVFNEEWRVKKSKVFDNNINSMNLN